MFRSWILDQKIVTPKLHLKTSEALTKLAPLPPLWEWGGASLSSRLQVNIPHTSFLLLAQASGYRYPMFFPKAPMAGRCQPQALFPQQSHFSLLILVPPKSKHPYPEVPQSFFLQGVAHGKGSMIPRSHSGGSPEGQNICMFSTTRTPELEPVHSFVIHPWWHPQGLPATSSWIWPELCKVWETSGHRIPPNARAMTHILWFQANAG